MNVLVPFGTRPEIVKLAPIVRALSARGLSPRTLATGQHSDTAMVDAFYDELGLEPDDRWTLSGDEAARVGTMLTLAHRELASFPELVLLCGDTYTVPVFCLAARAHRVPVAHVEAGLRSFNETSLEEVNRRVAATTASLHFAPTPLAAEFLRKEGVAVERIRVVGNPVIDAIRAAGIAPIPPDDRDGLLFTAHRATNVDDPPRLTRLVRLLLELAFVHGDVTFPVHPRTRNRLGPEGLDRLVAGGIRLTQPLPYREMLSAIARSRVVVTDSGGLQEEASWLGVPTVVLRRSTPRWESVIAGGSRLVGLDFGLALEAVARFSTPEEQERVASLPCPFGDGRTGERIAEILADPASSALLRVEEPDFVGKPPPGAVRAVLFDLDDTLYPHSDWLDGAWTAVASAAASHGVPEDAFREALVSIASEGSDRGRIVDRALERVGASGVPLEPLLQAFRAFRARLQPYAGVREALEDLRRTVPIGLVTDGDPAIQLGKLEALGLADGFDAVVLSDELGRALRKPNAAPFRAALETLGVEPQHAAYVGDNPGKDVAGAVAAGLRAIRVETGEHAGRPDELAPWARAPDVLAAIELLRPLLVPRAQPAIELTE
jgi:UDP-N-acetylglucosamine 2-epimerase (non-hydrolysing)